MKIFRAEAGRSCKEKNAILSKVYNRLPLDAERDRRPSTMGYASALAPHIVDTRPRFITRAARRQARAARGRAGDAARPRPRHVSVRDVVEPRRRRRARPARASGRGRSSGSSGSTKAYVTRVGSGPFPTEDHGAGRRVGMQERGREFGTTTGRERRRCGWIDAVLLRYAARLNGLTELVPDQARRALGPRTVKICVARTLRGRDATRSSLRTSRSSTRPSPCTRRWSGWTADCPRPGRPRTSRPRPEVRRPHRGDGGGPRDVVVVGPRASRRPERLDGA